MPGEATAFREYAKKLKVEQERTKALNDIKLLLSSTPRDVIKNSVQVVGLKSVFQCFSSIDEVSVGLACEVLEIALLSLPPGFIVQNYLPYFMHLLRHPNVTARKLAVDKVQSTLTTEPSILPFNNYQAVFVAISQLVGDKDVTLANKAIYITSNLSDELYPKVLEEMQYLLNGNTSCKCNVFEVIINISSKKPELLELVTQNGYLDFMLSELQSDDILYHLNILELLSRLAITTHGLNYLTTQGAINKLAEIISSLKSNPLGNLLASGYLKFLGSVAHVHPRDMLQKFPVLLEYLFGTIETGDPSLLPVAFDTLGIIGSSVEGKLSLIAIGHPFVAAVSKVAEHVRNSTTENKIRAVLCMSSLVSAEELHSTDPRRSATVDHRVTLMTREWFRSLDVVTFRCESMGSPDKLWAKELHEHVESGDSRRIQGSVGSFLETKVKGFWRGRKAQELPVLMSIGERPMEVLFEICKNPFPDIKLAALSLLNATCTHQWGTEMVANTPGFVEFILDRSLDYTKEAKQAKYEVVKRLARSSAFDHNTEMKLNTYVEQGPFYSEPMMSVATDDQ